MKNVVLFAFLVLLSACIKEPDYYPVQPDNQVAAPTGFDWKMIEDGTFSFGVLDASPAIVRIFTSVDGDLIASGAASVGSPFVTTLSLPQAQTSLFVQKIAADQSVVEQTISLAQASNYLFPVISVSQFLNVTSRVARELPVFDLIVSSGSSANLYNASNQVYRNVKITNGFVGSINFIWNNYSTVYIDGNVQITSMSNQDKPGNKIIVLSGATLTVGDFGGIDVEVDAGGTFHSTGAFSYNRNFLNAGSVVIDGNTTIYGQGGVNGHFVNNGSFRAKSYTQVTNANVNFENHGTATFDNNFEFASGALGSNSGVLTVAGSFKVTNWCVFNNSGSITAPLVELSASPTLTNSCHITTSKLTSGNDGCILNITRGALFTTDLLETTGGLTLNLNKGGIFKTVDLNVYQLRVTTAGTGDGIALFFYNHGIHFQNSYFTGPAQVVCPVYSTEQSSYSNVTFLQGATVVPTQTQSISKSDCNGGVGLIGGDVPNPDEPNTFLPSKDGFNTLVFEDMWPKEGDYDMNDLVVAFNIGYFESNNMVSRMILSGKVLAVGAAISNHALGLQLDQLVPASVQSITRSIALSPGVFTLNAQSGVESGSSAAVIPVFASVADVITITHQGNSYINTDPVNGSTATPVNWTVDVRFASPVEKSKLTLNGGLNFFMSIGGVRGKEVHLYGYEPTSLVNEGYFGTGDDNSINGARYSTHFGYPWALVIPGTFRYPLEESSMNQAYLHYDEWITTNKVAYPEWYLPVAGNVTESKLFPVLP